MHSILTDLTLFPQVETKTYDLYRSRQWHQAKAQSGSSTVSASGRNKSHDTLFDTKSQQKQDTMLQAKEQLGERGDKLVQLEAKFGELSNATKSFADNIKEYNARQAKKKWYEL